MQNYLLTFILIVRKLNYQYLFTKRVKKTKSSNYLRLVKMLLNFAESDFVTLNLFTECLRNKRIKSIL